MSLKQRLFGGVSPFAHLNGPVAPRPVTPPAPGAAAEPVAEPVIEPGANVPAPAAKDGKKAKKAKKSDDDDDDDEDGDEDSDEEEMRAEDDEEGDDDMKKGKKAFQRAIRGARLRERARCAAIFSTEAAAANPALAAQLAFMSANGRDTAVGILQAAAATNGGKTGLHQRMASVPQPNVSASGDPEGGAGGMRLADRALAARDAARPQKKRA